MALILSNRQIASGIYQMEVAYQGKVKPGQFFMLRAWDQDPLLSRPISVHDYQDGVLTFMYAVVGKGTEIMAHLGQDDEITMQGPNGNGFPEIDQEVAVVGGGIGIAPLYYFCKQFKILNPGKKLRAYLGFSKEAYGVEAFKAIADEVIVDVGGIITDKIVARKNEVYVGCGPTVMMKALCRTIPKQHQLYLSLEERMACGIGACLGCSIKTKEGNKKVCKDGPVFSREVLFYE